MKYLEFGDPAHDTVVFLHGGNVAGWMWGEQLQAVTDFHVLVPDLPGFGASNDMPWVSVQDSADRVAHLIGDRRAHVVGLSLGSSVAIELAARHPDAVATLFLASAQVTPPLRRDMLTARLLLRLFWRQRGFWAATARSYGLTGADAELFVDTGLGIDRSTALAVYSQVVHGIPAATLARVSAPTIAVAGERDSTAITGASLRRIVDEIPGSLVAIAPGMHHQWNIENIELFNRSLRAWLDRREMGEGLARVGFQADNHHSRSADS